MARDFETPAFNAALSDLLTWRRDVRRFRPDPIGDEVLEDLLRIAHRAPSVGLSQPWRFVRVRRPDLREGVRANFSRCNAAALQGYEGERAARYAGLKLSGLEEAPVHLAVFCEPDPEAGAGLGRATMPETTDYSVVTAIHTLWLAARARGIGMGWVSILDPLDIAALLETPPHWRLIAYLCLGAPAEAASTPELERQGWQDRQGLETVLFER